MFERVRRKASPPPQAGAGSEYGSPVGRRRKRSVVAGSGAAETLLPTTFHHNNSTPQQQQQQQQQQQLFGTPPNKRVLPASACNSFLLGGNYYPGKDKHHKRSRAGGGTSSRNRRRSLWYRIFCSSGWRVALTTLLLAHLLFHHILVPTFLVLLEYGKALSIPHYHYNNRDSSRGGPDPMTVPMFPVQHKLASVEEKIDETNRLQTVRDMARRESHSHRLAVMEDIVPDWYHRNDHAMETNEQQRRRQEEQDNTGPKAPNGGEKESTTKEQSAPSPAPQVNAVLPETVDEETREGTTQLDQQQQQQQQEQNKNKDSKPSSSSLSSSTTTQRIHADTKETQKGQSLRTLQTLEDHLEYPSACPLDPIVKFNTTLVVQTSLDRLFVLQETCRRWKDPIVVAVHLSQHDQQDSTSPPLYQQQLDSFAKPCPHVEFVQYLAPTDQKEWAYPVNRLRNLALDRVRTSHILVVDVDFVPSLRLDQTIQNVLRDRELQRQSAQHAIPSNPNRDAIVVPAFERKGDCDGNNNNDDVACGHFQIQHNSSFLPQTFSELHRCFIHDKDCIVFQAKNNWEGHWSTKSRRWLDQDWYDKETEIKVTLDDNKNNDKHNDGNKKATTEFQHPILKIDCFGSLRYEPYVVIRWCGNDNDKDDKNDNTNQKSPSRPVAPYYDERFHGYGKNKIQMISHLRFLGYGFSILPEGFLIHNPHGESKAKQTWNDVEDYKLHEKMDRLYPQFLTELVDTYRGVTDPHDIMQPCEHWEGYTSKTDKEEGDDDDEHSGTHHDRRGAVVDKDTIQDEEG